LVTATQIIALVVFLAVVLVPVFVFIRRGWRILQGKDEFVAGGSMGRQLTSPNRHSFRRLLRRLARLTHRHTARTSG
jgi:uncharacterized membrane protein